MLCIIRLKQIPNIHTAFAVDPHYIVKDKERFQSGLVAILTRDLFISEHLSEPFIEKHAISTELFNVNWEKHTLKSLRVCGRDREPSRIPV